MSWFSASRDCLDKYSADTRIVFDSGGSVRSHTVGIFDRDATSPLRLVLQQGMGDSAPVGECRLLDATVGGGTLDVAVQMGAALSFPCAAPAQCKDAGSCVIP